MTTVSGKGPLRSRFVLGVGSAPGASRTPANGSTSPVRTLAADATSTWARVSTRWGRANVMRFLGLPTDRLAGVVPLFVRLIAGPIMTAHGLQKLNEGIPKFTTTTLVPLGVPYADVLASAATYTPPAPPSLLLLALLSRP